MTDMFRTVDAQTLDNPIEQLIVECRTAERSGRLKVSDVHVTTDGEPYLRIDGELRAHEYPKLTVSDVKEFVDKVGAAIFGGLTITANLIMSLLIDNWGLFGMPVHSLNIWRVLGCALMIGGIALISRF